MLQAWAECDALGVDVETWPIASFHNAEAMAMHMPADLGKQLLEIVDPSRRKLVMCEQWTKFVNHHLEEMASKRQACKHALVVTPGGHAMALRLEIAGGKQKLQRFFDPNNMWKVVTKPPETEMPDLFGNDQDGWNDAFAGQDLTGGAKNCVAVYWLADAFNLIGEPVAGGAADDPWAGSCGQWPPNVVHDLLSDGTMPQLAQELLDAVTNEACSVEWCKALLFDTNLLKGGKHILHEEAEYGQLDVLDALVKVAMAGLKKNLITRQDLVQLLKSPFKDTSVLEAAVLAGEEAYVKHFLTLVNELNKTEMNGNRVLTREDIDEVTALSEDTQLKADKQILGRYEELRQKLRN
jgi:hypothetical protein